MATSWVIITGHSRGMGEAMARQCLAEGKSVLGISRKEMTADASVGTALQQWQCDLADAAPVAARLAAWLGAFEPSGVASVVLINNAALLSPPAPLHEVSCPDLVAAIRVGLEAPVLLTQAFLATTQPWVTDGGWSGERKVMQISSGLGRSAMGSVGSYCAVKAGLDNFSASVALDQARLASGAKIVSLAPGIIATDMQVQLREADGSGFPDQAKFIGFLESGALDTPSDAAAKCLAYLGREDFGSVVIADVRQ